MAQRDVDRREAAAQAAARSFERSIAAADQQAPLGTGLVRFTFEREGLKAEPPNRVWWVPVPPKLGDVETRVFAAAETFEYPGRGRQRQGGLHRPGSFAHRGSTGLARSCDSRGSIGAPIVGTPRSTPIDVWPSTATSPSRVPPLISRRGGHAAKSSKTPASSMSSGPKRRHSSRTWSPAAGRSIARRGNSPPQISPTGSAARSLGTTTGCSFRRSPPKSGAVATTHLGQAPVRLSAPAVRRLPCSVAHMMEPRLRWQSHPPSSTSGRRPRPQTPDLGPPASACSRQPARGSQVQTPIARRRAA